MKSHLALTVDASGLSRSLAAEFRRMADAIDPPNVEATVPVTLASLWLPAPTHSGFWWHHRSGLRPEHDTPEPVEVRFAEDGSGHFTVRYPGCGVDDTDEDLARYSYTTRWLPMLTPASPQNHA